MSMQYHSFLQVQYNKNDTIGERHLPQWLRVLKLWGRLHKPIHMHGIEYCEGFFCSNNFILAVCHIQSQLFLNYFCRFPQVQCITATSVRFEQLIFRFLQLDSVHIQLDSVHIHLDAAWTHISVVYITESSSLFCSIWHTKLHLQRLLAMHNTEERLQSAFKELSHRALL